MTRLFNWIPVFTGMTWTVDSGPDSNAGQAFGGNDGGNPNDGGEGATRLPRPDKSGLAMTLEIAIRCST